MKNYKCIDNTETNTHVSWGEYFTVGETYTEGSLPDELEALQMIVDARGDSLVLRPDDKDSPLPFIVPMTHFELVE